MGEFLRGDYHGNASAFVVPVSAPTPDAPSPAGPPSERSDRSLDLPLPGPAAGPRPALAIGSGRF